MSNPNRNNGANPNLGVVSLKSTSAVGNSQPQPLLSAIKRRIVGSRRDVIVTVAVVIALTSVLGSVYAFHLFESSATSCGVRPASAANTAVFTIVMANEGQNVGFNGSAYHTGYWPALNVTVGENVVIHVINNDTVQAHGFLIVNYFRTGIPGGLAPGRCYDVRFTANVQGSFAIQCNILCAIHEFMINGRLNVNP